MKYGFLIDTYEAESVKVSSVWSEFKDEDLPVRPRSGDLPAAPKLRCRDRLPSKLRNVRHEGDMKSRDEKRQVEAASV